MPPSHSTTRTGHLLRRSTPNRRALYLLKWIRHYPNKGGIQSAKFGESTIDWLFPPRKRKFIQSNCYLDWISRPFPSPDPIHKPFARRITSVWVERLIKCRLFAAKTSANTVSWLTSYLLLLLQIEWFDLFDCVIVYLIAPSSTSDIQLIFTLGTGTSQDRNWKIRISLLACSSTSLLGIHSI